MGMNLLLFPELLNHRPLNRLATQFKKSQLINPSSFDPLADQVHWHRTEFIEESSNNSTGKAAFLGDAHCRAGMAGEEEYAPEWMDRIHKGLQGGVKVHIPSRLPVPLNATSQLLGRCLPAHSTEGAILPWR